MKNEGDWKSRVLRGKKSSRARSGSDDTLEIRIPSFHKYVNASGEPLLDENGEVLYEKEVINTVSQDEQKLLRGTFWEAVEAAKAKPKRAQNVSHLRTWSISSVSQPRFNRKGTYSEPIVVYRSRSIRRSIFPFPMEVEKALSELMETGELPADLKIDFPGVDLTWHSELPMEPEDSHLDGRMWSF